MRLGLQDRLFVLTGAGISAESGLATFRGSGGLWNGFRVEVVAAPEGWQADPALVWRFYSQRRQEALLAQPNAAHRALVALEEQLAERFFLCTQNVDDLHERAGSGSFGGRVLHMHGSLFASRCERCNVPFADVESYTAQLPCCRGCGGAVRPHIVWFGEVPLELERIYAELAAATHMLVVGTSGSVYPAAGLVRVARNQGTRTVYVGPEEPLNADQFDEILLGTACSVLPTLARM
ncbi:MAG: NAD-dependent deacylase [Acidobacteriota bacterium]|nr:NAD-dependent deacylase [Acidobacteriota bacterium]